MIKLVKPILLSLSLLLSMSACTSRPDLSQQSAIKNDVDLQQSWQISGRIAFITQSERKSAYLSWQQKGTHYAMVLSTLLGGTIADIKYDGSLATLSTEDQEWVDPSAERLLYQTTGWRIPTESLPLWIQGIAQSNDQLSYYENGLIKTLSPSCFGCTIWEIEYARYAEFNLAGDSHVLPSLIRLNSKDLRLIIRIDDWKAL